MLFCKPLWSCLLCLRYSFFFFILLIFIFPLFSALLFVLEVTIEHFPLLNVFTSYFSTKLHMQPSRGVLKKRCSKNMQEIYRRTPMPKCYFDKVALLDNFIEITLWVGSSPVNLLNIFWPPLLKNTSGCFWS